MDYKTIASPEAVAELSEGLRARNMEPIVVGTREEALETIKSIIPPGASVMNGSSETLADIGYIEYMKEGQHGWNDLHGAVAQEGDPVRQKALRKIATMSEYYLGSAHAVTEEGELVIASGTGSQLPNIVFNSQNVIFVIGAQKIVPTLAEAMQRLEAHVFPLEDAKLMKKHGEGTLIGKVVIFNEESKLTGRKIRVIIVNESLGY